MDEKKEGISGSETVSKEKILESGAKSELKAMPEPPKFNLEDLPEPPKVGEQKKKGVFGKMFSKNKTNENAKTNNEKPLIIPKEGLPPIPILNQQFDDFDKEIDKEIEKKTSKPEAASPESDIEKNNLIPPPPALSVPPRIVLSKSEMPKVADPNKDIQEPKFTNLPHLEDVDFPFEQKELSTPGIKDMSFVSTKKDSNVDAASLPLPPLPNDIHIDNKKEGKKGLFSNIFKKKSKAEKAPTIEDASVGKDISAMSPPKLEDDDMALLKEIPLPPESMQKRVIPGNETIPLPPPLPASPGMPAKMQSKKPFISADMPPIPDFKIRSPDEKLEEKLPGDIKSSDDEAESTIIGAKKVEAYPAVITEDEIKEELEKQPMAKTPLSEIPGVGKKTETLLKKKLKIKTAEELADHDHEHVAKVTKISPKTTKKLVAHAKKIKKKSAGKASKKKKIDKPKEGTISDLISSLEQEKKDIQKLKAEGVTDLPDLRGHKDILGLLEKLEKKKLEIFDYENNLKDKEKKIHSIKSTYKRDAEYLDNMKRRLDHDVRERTKYLIDLEKEFFEKGQKLAKDMSKIELKEEHVKTKETELKENEKELRLKLHELEDREINISAKEKSLKKILQQLEKQELLLKKKEEELAGSDVRFVKRMEVLKQHEIETDRLLRQKQKEILDREKELKRLEKDLEKRERVVDIEDRALNYAETDIESQRKKLEDDEFRQYLHEKLGLMKEAGININDIQQSQVIKVPDLQEHRETIQDLIAKCRHMVKLGRTREAKLFYNKIRQLFYSLTFPTKSEKENLFNTVRLIYDEINLAEMEGNNN